MKDDRGEPTTASDPGRALGLHTLSLARHRSLDRLTLSPSTMVGIVLVPALFNAIEWRLRGQLSANWAGVLAFWLDKLGIEGTTGEHNVSFIWFNLPLPYLEVAAGPPDARTWWTTLIVTLLACILARYIRGRFLPLRYLLLFAICIEATALMYFAVGEKNFPYTVSGYVDNGVKTSAVLLFVLPWGHALVYYIFDFSWSRKILLTVLSIAFVVVAVPLQMALHVYLLSRGSLMMMPLLSFVFGPTLIILGCIALYGWAMSWERNVP
ncbi:hypothetical protein [Cupriavidus pauculus]|uniref:Uncharacterized protein n=1 Tax=Cupriavidus pauculus TaxID=82633 RepID=A0A3G8H2U5_9BURK|nr:hypothetical protein [Cupriavidus pauculus]AZG14639.1 hypothetical protein EHF44_15020 [Cupriavidus pauculus]